MNTNDDEIYLEIYSIDRLSLAPIETIITLFTIKYCEMNNMIINFVLREKEDKKRLDFVDLSHFDYNGILKPCEIPEYASNCQLPNMILKNSKTCVAGLCASLRQIIKNKIAETPSHYSKELLGFKNACLLSCSESSVWTKFCEIDLIETIKCFYSDENLFNHHEIPVNIARFECHMSKPVRLHNLYKYTMSKKYSRDGDNVVDDKDNRIKIPEHTFAEGSYVTLADIIIFVCIHVFFSYNNITPAEEQSDENNLGKLIPLTIKWYKKMIESDLILTSMRFLEFTGFTESPDSPKTWILPSIENQSLYKSDPKRYKPRNRIYTRQTDINESLDLIKELNISTDLDSEPFARDMAIDWEKIPKEATPEGGELPEKRLTRKYDQLENLCKPVLALAKEGDVIVDFCSGGGHLGILIGYLLPKCEIILLENKEESLNRAKERVKRLELTNIKFYQCNLDYFKGNFDIGVSLHACGVATDLVIQHCLNINAVFVSCPCCYGAVHDCHRINYPRSDIFRNKIENKNYLVLGHSADQTHDKNNSKTEQGYKCMSIIDTDRKLHAQQYNYIVHFSKLLPNNCTPKNHLLVGIPKN